MWHYIITIMFIFFLFFLYSVFQTIKEKLERIEGYLWDIKKSSESIDSEIRK
jgi:hypothetical protein